MTIHKHFSPAKLNLNLQITSKREDGFHEMDSVFAKIKFGDYLTFIEKKEGIELRSSGSVKIPTNADNLVYKAANLMRTRAKGKRGIKIEIEKNIPTGAGLGGGSSNAAITMKLLNKFWDINFSEGKLCELALQIGADVPFFIQEKSALRLTGIGEVFEEEVVLDSSKQVILVNPRYISINSAWAYGVLDRFYKDDFSKTTLNENTFEKAVFNVFPDLEKIKKQLLEAGAESAMLTGSGSVVFGVFEKGKDLSEIVTQLEERGEVILTGFVS